MKARATLKAGYIVVTVVVCLCNGSAFSASPAEPGVIASGHTSERLTGDPFQCFFEETGKDPLDPLGRVAFPPWDLLRLKVDLNGDGKDEVFLAKNLRIDRQGNFYSVFISDGDNYIVQDEMIIGWHPTECWIRAASPGLSAAVVTYSWGGAGKGVLRAFTVVNRSVEEAVIERDVDLGSDSDIGKVLDARYQRGKVERIPGALAETLTGVSDIDVYLKERETKGYTDPVKDYVLRHAKPLGQNQVDGEPMLLKLEADINDDGHPEVFLTNSRLKIGEVGYWWEAYVSDGDTYRWQRDSLVFQDEVRVQGGQMVAYAKGEKTNGLLLRINATAGRLTLSPQDVTSSSGGTAPLQTFPAGFAAVTATRVPFPAP